ncbi:Glutamyl-tRNA synthetase [Actinomortierella ambigua]|uniref:Glutamate--tRNA ligase, mitochondrial n=1 Tax=Actinomortierella ambigua TaxID=1343610 RepID=A0A9P6QIA7_9FUNG|nr:Glutamyl-tRNA synthetase [Actinomortierella ambigua]
MAGSETGTSPESAARVRFAPSPTGYLHLGGLRTALYNYLLAKKTGGQCLLRIEDTDQTRYVPGATESLLRAFDWAGIRFDEGPTIGGPHEPYEQSKRLDIYHKHVGQLLHDGHAYRCFCSSDRLSVVRLEAQKAGRTASYDRKCMLLSAEESQEKAQKGEPFVVRMKVPEGTTIVHDDVHGNVTFSNKELDDSVLLKSDGFPTYHLANVVDDHLMDINQVVRGQEWLPSAPKHVLLYEMFGWKVPRFAHVPLLLNPDKSKLSKRSGDVNVEDYKDKGYFPEAVVNFVALLGWHPGSTQEIFNMDELADAFSLDHIQQSNAVVLREKLDWINKMHLLRKAETSEGLLEMAVFMRPKLEQVVGPLANQVTDEYIAKVIDTLKERIKNVYDVPLLCSYYFRSPDYSSEDSKSYRSKVGDETLHKVLPTILKQLSSVSESTPLSSQEAKEALKKTADQHSVKLPVVMNAVRYAVTGVKVGAGVPETMATLGREPVVERIQNILK